MSLLRALPCLLVLAACGEPTVYNAVEGPRGGAAVPVAQLQAQTVQLVNTQRAQIGLPPLTVEPQLQSAAQSFASQPGGSTILARARNSGYGGCVLTETMANGQSTPEGVLARWVSSPSERETLLSPAVSQIGLGVAPDPAGGNRWALALGTPC